jgi:hypothetical protein
MPSAAAGWSSGKAGAADVARPALDDAARTGKEDFDRGTVHLNLC